jgi:hypothetical protein
MLATLRTRYAAYSALEIVDQAASANAATLRIMRLLTIPSGQWFPSALGLDGVALCRSSQNGDATYNRDHPCRKCRFLPRSTLAPRRTTALGRERGWQWARRRAGRALPPSRRRGGNGGLAAASLPSRSAARVPRRTAAFGWQMRRRWMACAGTQSKAEQSR